MTASITKYYSIYCVASNKKKAKLVPFVFDTKEQMSLFLETSLDSSIDLSTFFPNDKNVSLVPFLAFEKTMISSDYIESEEESLMEDKKGEILGKIIPVDYVSELFYRKQVRAKGLTKKIRELIFESSKGVGFYG
jgi:hypothetical protein